MKLFSALALCAAMMLSAQAAEKYKIKLASTYESNVPVLGDAPKKFKELVEKMSDGRIEVRVDYPSKHKAAFALLDMVKSAQYDAAFPASYFYKGKDAKLMLFTTVPFGMNKAEQDAWYAYGGGKELAQKVFNEYGIVTFHGGNFGMQMGGWFKKEINSTDDLQGLKLRMTGLGGEIMAMEMNTIDAVEWVCPAIDINFGFQKVAKFYYTGWQEPASENEFYINKKLWDKIPADLQAIVETATKAVAADVYESAVYQNSLVLDKIKSEHPDVKIASFPPEIIAALRKATDEILDELSAKDATFKEILDSQKAFMKKARVWTQISENSYINSTTE